MTANNAYQMQEFAYTQTQMNRQRQAYEEDFAYSQQVRQLQHGWQMEDYDISIRRSSGFQRKQLVKQKERDTELYNLESGQIDRQKKRQEDQFKLEEDHFKKQVEHAKTLMKWAEDDFNKQKARFEETTKWRNDEFDIQRSRIQQEIAWATENAARTIKSFEIRQQQLDAEISAAKVEHEMKQQQHDAEVILEAEKFKLSQIIIGMTKQEQENIKFLQDQIKGMRDEEAKRVADLQKLQWEFYQKMLEWLKLQLGAQGGTGGENSFHRATGGRLSPGNIVGEIGPEMVVADRGSNGLSVLSTKALTPRPESFSGDVITVEGSQPIVLDGKQIAVATIKFLVDPMQIQKRRKIRK